MQKSKEKKKAILRKNFGCLIPVLNSQFSVLMVLTPLFCAALPDLYLSYLQAAQKPLNVLPQAL